MWPRSLQHHAVCALVGVLLGACGNLGIESKKVDYKSTGKLPPLEIPPDLTRPSADDRYVVPDINPKGTATYSEYTRDRSGARGSATVASLVLPTTTRVRVERDGNQRWLVVIGTPDQVWPVVKSFWQETGFIVNLELPEAGIMETDWAENRAKLPGVGVIRNFLGKFSPYETGERDKFRTRLEHGVKPATTEIYISHRGMEEVYTTAVNTDQVQETMWQPRPPDPTLEAEMLGRLMTRFGVEEKRAKKEVASVKEAPARARLIDGTDGSTLALNDQFDRAWRRVGLALDRVGFTVEDRNRAKGLYYVRYIDPQTDVQTKKETGWLSKLAFWKSSEPPKPEQYRIQVTDKQSVALVNVLNKDGSQDHSDTSNRILTLLYNQLK
ncbi:MAG: outer membrane protein assembly factor BamC [Betaproteobacteria bacterium]|nr:outer membrane protein assembly factor BamC [Betaproteobacteria bacterium]MDH3437927.1 outer membrane protein assembly factor BamC [Betaproteobacteria bacterium]